MAKSQKTKKQFAFKSVCDVGHVMLQPCCLKTNQKLKMQCKENGFGFLDTHQLTNRGDGMSNGSWHIDDYHLSPEGMLEAWRRCNSEKSYYHF